MSTAFHPQIDGQSERTIQVLEDMLRACVLDHKGSWEEHLPLVEFAYNCNTPKYTLAVFGHVLGIIKVKVSLSGIK